MSMCILYLFHYFVEINWLQYIVVLLALAAFIASSSNADPLPRWLGFFMMAVGVMLEISKGTGVEGISNGIFTILPLLCLITLAPLLSIPLRLGGYFEAISALLRNLLHQPRRLYAGITTTLFLLSPVLSLGSVRIINDFLKDLKLPSAVSAKSYLVGFSTSVLWSPYFASVSLVLYYLNIPFKEYILYGIALSLISLIIGNVLFVVWERKNPILEQSHQVQQLQKKYRNQLIILSLFIVLLMSTCLIIESITHWSMVVIVCLISIFIPLLSAVTKHARRKLKPFFIDYRDRTVPMMNNEMMLFMSAGLLGFALQGTNLANGVNAYLVDLAGHSFILFALAILAGGLVVTYVGIHQIAVVGALAMQLNAQELGISNIALAMLLLLTWSISSALSPFSGLNLMVSRFAGISGVQVGLRANGVHLTILATIGILFISFIN
ncbi:hypothetical protein [Litchfieldia alkalitelluris]|uniref:hypothetical protein n=1 Tax=Litchfieldia alkalitelluris TaxID=304268 RepID=UPI00195CE939|nr:hypothetical protein [Litchfieldia alkalitelluris]